MAEGEAGGGEGGGGNFWCGRESGRFAWNVYISWVHIRFLQEN